MTDALTEAANLAELFEGFRASPYPDPGTGGDPWTQGFGSTHNEDTGEPIRPDSPPIDRATGLRWLEAHLRRSLCEVRQDVRVPLTADEEAALTDFVYNVGDGNFHASTLLRLLNAGDYAGAAAQFTRWDMAGGRHLAGLLRRREAERAVFLSADNTAQPAPHIPSADNTDDLNAAELREIGGYQ